MQNASVPSHVDNYIELIGNKCEYVEKYWKVEVIEFEEESSGEINYAVRIISTLKGQSITFPKEIIGDSDFEKMLLKRLGRIGVIKSYHLKIIENSVNNSLYEETNKIIKAKDISNFLIKDVLTGTPTIFYYKKIINHLQKNPELYPTRSSNKYDENVSYGAILDNLKKHPIGKYGHYPVAIRSGALLKLFNINNCNKYSEVVNSLVQQGFIQGKLTLKDFDNMIPDMEYDSFGSISFENNCIKKKKRKSHAKGISMKTKGDQIDSYIVNIDLSYGDQNVL
ncbi:hypothetical protein [Alkalihalophilus marmarensis]|uniref:Uncharacterized protein n=1 Tax=Alkalihalophilus marmarensis DSM 21297 TaxID=1188261 RepID=U6SJR0_9BACI|nr:hypothetical protein [Alkalihalophilus marmarensis]ERN51627.1 hypothetical protein A33I_20045 [Alkalihalophilus marmarensis DSM 21297]